MPSRPIREIVSMAFDTVRTQKLRSALTILGILIGITSIVGVTGNAGQTN